VLSTLQAPQALRLPLRWIALLYGRVGLDLAGSGGVHNALDVVRLSLAGASVAMLASELLRHGIHRLAEIRRDLDYWLGAHGYESLAQLRGSLSEGAVAFPAAFERAQYLNAVAQAPPDAAAAYDEQRADHAESGRQPLTADRWPDRLPTERSAR
jgi:dihydroorotate dehydrogenase (fumarate)